MRLKFGKRVIGIFLAVMLCCWIAAPTSNALVISLEPADPTITVGSDFSIDVFVGNLELDEFDEVLAFGFDIFDPSSAFTFYGADFSSSYFVDDSSRFPNTEVAGSVFPGLTDAFGPILLTRLSFTAEMEGVHSLGIVSNRSDPNQGLFTCFDTIDLFKSVDVNVVAAPVPEPGTMVLMLMGIGGLSFLKRRRA